jgi:spoIIIJ-associated protein
MSEAYEAIEVSALTVDEAIKEALEKLGAAEDDVIIQVLSTPRAGVLGLGARQARVRVVRRPLEAARSGVTSPPPAPPLPPRTAEPTPETAPAPAVRPAVLERPTAVEQARPAARPAPPAPPREGYARHKEELPRPSAARAERGAETRAEAPPEERAVEEEEGLGGRKPADLDAQVSEASAILTRILELMGERGEITVTEEDSEGIELAIKGDGSGLLIGRHGQTLDALEYLVNRVLARKIRDAVPITIDTECYRERRRRQLHRMALSMAEQTKREHATVTLDPMPPRDRRIVHLALKDDPLITTRSTGDGFLRAVEIIPVGERREGGGGSRRERGGPQRGREREGERGQERESERDREREAPVGQQGGFKRGQKRII